MTNATNRLQTSDIGLQEEEESNANPEARSPKPEARTAKVKRRASAEAMSAAQKEISVSEFFAKNRHLLGFDNPRKALLTTVKEAVDNSLDACEEAGILPEIWVQIEQTDKAIRVMSKIPPRELARFYVIRMDTKGV